MSSIPQCWHEYVVGLPGARERLILCFGRMVRCEAKRLGSVHDVSDISQSAWSGVIVALSAAGQDNLAAFRSYALRQCRRAIREEIRSITDMPSTSGELDGGSKVCGEHHEFTGFWETVKSALDEREYKIILGRFWYDRKFSDMAPEFGMSQNGVSNICYRAMKKLKRNVLVWQYAQDLWSEYPVTTTN